MNMIIKRKVFLILLIIVVLSSFIFFKVNKYFHSEKYEIEKGYNMKLTKENSKKLNVFKNILLAIENYVSFDDLAVSDNFKKKYKNGNDIIPNKNQYSDFSTGYMTENGKHIISIFADKKETLIDIIKDNEPITTMFYFEYKIDDEGLLDDLILVDSYDVYSITGEKINENTNED